MEEKYRVHGEVELMNFYEFNLLLEGLHDTSWSNEKGKTVSLQQLLKIVQDYPVTQVPIEEIEKIALRKDGGGIENARVDNADLSHPIIVVVERNGNMKYILDGNHRAQKAMSLGMKSIPARLVDVSRLPKEFQDVLN